MTDLTRILILIADLAERQSLEEILKTKGYVTLAVAEAGQAIEALTFQQFSVAVIDLQLKDMPGLETMRRIKDHSPLTECLLITGQPSADSAIEAVNLGAFAYVPKPYEIEPLVLTISRATQKSEARQALRLSESKYRRLHRSTMDAFVMTDMTGRLQEWNQVYREMLGYTDEELSQLTYMDLTPARWRDFEAGIVHDQIIPRGHSEVYEKEYRRKDGLIIPVELRTFLLRDDAGEPLGMWAMVRDITQRTNLQKSLLIAHEELERKNKLLAAISRTQSRLIVEEKPAKVFGGILDDVLKLTGSEFGFMGEVLQTPEGRPYLKTYALTDIAWNEKTRVFYREHTVQGLEFFNLDTLFGAVLKTAKTVIANDPATDPRRGGLPAGHPPIHSFLGAPLSIRGRMVGMIGVANRAGGYDESMVAFLEPMLLACAEIIEAFRAQAFRRQAEEALRHSRQEWEEIFHAIGHLTLILSPDQKIVAINRKGEQLLGQLKGHIIGKYCYEVFHGASTPPSFCPFHRMKENLGTEIDDVEVEALGRHFLVSCTPVLRPDGTIDKVIHMATDITERKRSEEALQASQKEARLLSDLLEHSSQPFAVSYLDGRLGLCNDAYCNLVGYTKKELQDIFWSRDLTPPKWHEIEQTHLNTLHASGAPIRYEKEYIHKNGHLISVGLFVHLQVDNQNQPLYYYSFINDITEQKRSEQLMNLRLMLAEFGIYNNMNALATKTLDEIGKLTQSPIGFFHFVEPDQVHLSIQAWSTRTTTEFCTALGKGTHYRLDQAGVWVDCFYQKRPVIHNNYSELSHRKGMPPGHALVVRELLLPIIRNEKVVAILGVGNKPSNYNQQDVTTAARIAEMVWDIIERKRGDEEKAKLQDQLRHSQKMDAIGRLAGGVAHDFNNMLTVISGYADIATMALNKHDPIYTDIQEIKKAAQRSADLTTQLLAFARKQSVEPKALDLNNHVDNSLKFIKRLVGEDIQSMFIKGSDLWTIHIDPSQLDQILANLAVNSRDAIVNVGKITVQTANVVLDVDYCAQHVGCKPGEYVQMSFSDTGRGMDNETVAQIFEPFFTTKEKGKGTGLGLSTVYGIVKQNEGYIDVHSEPNIGSCFTIFFPRFKGTPSSPTGPTIKSEGKGSETLLLVDDEEQILKVYNKALTMRGYNVITANCPKAALLAAEKYKGDIQLLITDIIMPDMNGVELSGLISVTRPNLKTLFISGYPRDTVAGRALLGKEAKLLQKPVLPLDLANKVREILDQ